MAEWVEYLNSDGDSSVVRERWANGQKEAFGVKYFGVGNENWGCGGNMRPEYYADEYRRYQTYCRDYGSHKLYRIACGANSDDYRWTDVVMERAGNLMDALTLHYYTWTGEDWQHKGSATDFTRQQYEDTLRTALRMDEMIQGHLQIMDKHDPDHRVGLIVDEWGTWFDVEPDTNPGFLYQQNTMRDALVAALTLNIFNAHCDRVVMANLAQTVNVLQAVILTEGDTLVLTPTYHVFDLYKAHQGGTALGLRMKSDLAAEGLPQLHASASLKEGVLTLTVANTAATQSAQARVTLLGMEPGRVSGRVLSGDIGEYNHFAQNRLRVKPFEGVALEKDGLRLELPACSVVEVTCRRNKPPAPPPVLLAEMAEARPPASDSGTPGGDSPERQASVVRAKAEKL